MAIGRRLRWDQVVILYRPRVRARLSLNDSVFRLLIKSSQASAVEYEVEFILAPTLV